MKIVFSKEELSKIFDQNVVNDAFDICLDSKEVKNGDLFIALEGERVDGHKFIEEAIKKGANLAISQKDIAEVPNEKIIRVNSTYDALLKLAKYKKDITTNVKYIAVTGSVGKTTTRNMISHLLLKCFGSEKVYAAKKNYNSKIGLPVCVALMPKESEFAVFEMGMSESGDIRKLTDIINPSVAVITTIGESHLEFFESPFDIAKAKSEIFERSPEYAVIPNDSPYTDFLKNKASICGVKNIILFGERKESDARVLSYDIYDDFIKVSANIFGNDVKYNLRCSNTAFAINSVAAISAVHVASGISPNILADNISSFEFTSKRCEIVHIKNITIIDDSYNAAPTSMKAALRTLGTYKSKGRKIAVVGDMLELGPNAVFFHENLSATIDKYGIDLVFACGNLSKRLFDNLSECKKGVWQENSHKLAENILNELKDGDCVLVKGSHSMNMDYIVDTLKNNLLN